MSKELFENDLIEIKTNKNAFDSDEDDLDTPGGETILNPRIIGGSTEDTTQSSSNEDAFVTYTFYEHTVEQATDKGIPATIVIDRACTIDKVYIHVGTAPGAGKTITVDVNLNGTTIFTTQAGRPSITGTATVDESSTPNVRTLSKNDLLTMDIDTHDGSAEYLTVYIRCH